MPYARLPDTRLPYTRPPYTRLTALAKRNTRGVERVHSLSCPSLSNPFSSPYSYLCRRIREAAIESAGSQVTGLLGKDRRLKKSPGFNPGYYVAVLFDEFLDLIGIIMNFVTFIMGGEAYNEFGHDCYGRGGVQEQHAGREVDWQTLPRDQRRRHACRCRLHLRFG